MSVVVVNVDVLAVDVAVVVVVVPVVVVVVVVIVVVLVVVVIVRVVVVVIVPVVVVVDTFIKCLTYFFENDARQSSCRRDETTPLNEKVKKKSFSVCRDAPRPLRAFEALYF